MAHIAVDRHRVEELDRPLFVAAFKGLFDMGEAATSAIDWLSMTHQSRPGASIDPELLFDFQEVRPQIQLGVNGNREIHWPANNLVWAKTAEGHRDLLLLGGVEPNLRWKSFCRTVFDIVTELGCEQMVTLGSSLATIPHSRAFPVSASTADEALAEELGIGRPSYEGPTGLIGSLHDYFNSEGLPTVSLAVSIPHYVPGSPSPKATSALLASLEQHLDVVTEHAGLADEVRDWEARVHRALDEDDDVRSYVSELEAKADADPKFLLDSSGMTDEIENFLRGHDDD